MNVLIANHTSIGRLYQISSSDEVYFSLVSGAFPLESVTAILQDEETRNRLQAAVSKCCNVTYLGAKVAKKIVLAECRRRLRRRRHLQP